MAVKAESAVAYNNICAAYNALKLWDQAIAACQRALAIDPSYTLAQNNLRAAQAGDPGPAGSPSSAGGPTPTKSYADYINDSLAFYNAGDYQKSIEAAQRGLQLQPNSAIAYNNLCTAYNQLKLWDKAIEACQRAIAIDPNFALAKNNLSVALQAKQKQ